MNLISSREWADAKRKIAAAEKDLESVEGDQSIRNILKNIIEANKTILRAIDSIK